MNRIQIEVSIPYQVIIGEEILRQIGTYVTETCKAERVVIISDTNVWPLYGDTVVQSLCDRQVASIRYVVPAGEQCKSLHMYTEIITFLTENHLTRSDAIIALGGGTVGDLAGFVAATYLRGIPLIQVPTSLLAMVDSSVGGKTALDLPMGKNLIGTFYHPRLVICDIETLRTLPTALFHDGCAEVIKYGILYDANLFMHLQDRGTSFDREYVISRCIELKAEVVETDEFDHAERQKLNLGHTIGHALETLSAFALSHGQAVAAGIAIVARSALQSQYCSPETTEQIIALLKQFQLPIDTHYTSYDISCVAGIDKKRRNNVINLIIPKRIGECIIEAIPIGHLESFIEAGL